MKLGMVGLPNVGKSTIFNALTNARVQSANYPFCTIEKNVGVVPVPDERLDFLAKMYEPNSFKPATLEIVDIAGLVRGASEGEGLGNQFLADIREVDAIVHVVRCFEGTNVIHVDGSVDPARDIDTINLELEIADCDMVKRRLDRAKKQSKGDKNAAALVSLLERLQAHLEDGRAARNFEMNREEKALLADMPLLSGKPVIYAANLSEDDFVAGLENRPNFCAVKRIAEEEGAVVMPVCARIEEEIAGMSEDDKAIFLSDLGLEDAGLGRIIRAGYQLLGLISFLTAGKKEVRAWTIKKGTRAPQAAGKIHSDFERGFIRAEVVNFRDLYRLGSMAAVREAGLLRSEGKEYIMHDGDVVEFRFHV